MNCKFFLLFAVSLLFHSQVVYPPGSPLLVQHLPDLPGVESVVDEDQGGKNKDNRGTNQTSDSVALKL